MARRWEVNCKSTIQQQRQPKPEHLYLLVDNTQDTHTKDAWKGRRAGRELRRACLHSSSGRHGLFHAPSHARPPARAVPFFGAELKYVFFCRMLLNCIRCSIRMQVVVPFYFILFVTLYNRALYHGAYTSIIPSIVEFSTRGKMGRCVCLSSVYALRVWLYAY